MKGLTHCRRCDARFNPETVFAYGYYLPGTSGSFQLAGHTKKGDCPICRKPVEGD